MMKKACIILFTGFLLLILQGCSPQQGNDSTNPNANSAKLAVASLESAQSKTVRAEGKSDCGVLSIVPNESEIIEQLGAPSVYGEAEDYSFKGSYTVFFKDNSGKETVIAKLDDLQIIQPQNAMMSLQKLSTVGTDIYCFIPQYRGASDVPVYFFGVEKNGDAFPFKIENNKAQESGNDKVLSDSTVVLSTTSKNFSPPFLKNKNLVVRAVYNIGEGQNYEIYNITFQADVKDHLLKYSFKERYDDPEAGVF